MKQMLSTLVIVALVTISCKKIDRSKLGFNHMRFFTTIIVNPGDSTLRNSSIDLYSPINDSMWYDAYSSIHGKELGYYVTAGVQVADELWLMAPLDEKIVILDAENLSFKSEITGITSPQCIQEGKTEVYVGSKTKRSLYAINIDTHNIKEIPLSHTNVTDIAYRNSDSVDTIYVACHEPSCHRIYVTFTGKDIIMDSIRLLNYAPLEISLNDGRVLDILCGSEEYGIPYALNMKAGQLFNLPRVHTLPTGANYKNLIACGEAYSQSYDILSLIANEKTGGDRVQFYIDFPNITPTNYEFDGPGTDIEKMHSNYAAPNGNMYLIATNVDGKVIGVRTKEYFMRDILSVLKLRDSKSFLLFKPE